MGILSMFGRKTQTTLPPVRVAGKNPHTGMTPGHKRSFGAADVSRLTDGWLTDSSAINSYLSTALPAMRARSRDLVRNNPYAKRYSTVMKSNIVGPQGITVQAASTWFQGGKEVLDTRANDAIELAYKKWGERTADLAGSMSWVEMQQQSIGTAVTDGEFIFRKHYSNATGFQLQAMDPALLDITRNKTERNGNITLMGIEHSPEMMPLRYFFRRMDSQGNYNSGIVYSVPADEIIHVYKSDWVGQCRGVPWMHAAMVRMKQLDGYDEAAITAARHGAAHMGFFTSETGEGYQGDGQDAEGNIIHDADPGTFHQLPAGMDLRQYDPKYPHDQYPHFTKVNIQGMSAGMDISYPTLSNDLEGVNYSSIRAGVLEDRELFKTMQGWLIRSLIVPVFEEWIEYAVLRGEILVGSRPLTRPVEDYRKANYQGRRWSWVDPQKDMNANELSVKLKTRSRSQIIRDQGDDPETTWREIERENEILGEYTGDDGNDQEKPEQPQPGAEKEDDES